MHLHTPICVCRKAKTEAITANKEAQASALGSFNLPDVLPKEVGAESNAASQKGLVPYDYLKMHHGCYPNYTKSSPNQVKPDGLEKFQELQARSAVSGALLSHKQGHAERKLQEIHIKAISTGFHFPHASFPA